MRSYNAGAIRAALQHRGLQCTSSHHETHKNVVLHSVATALASMVFPVPLGPYSSTPFQGASRPENSSGYLIGCTTASFSSRLA